MTIEAGDLVEARLLPSRGYIGKTARILANLGMRHRRALSALTLPNLAYDINFRRIDQQSKGLKVPSVKVGVISATIRL